MAKQNELELELERLDDLYKFKATAEKLGKPFPEEYLEELTELEEQIIRRSVLPLIHDNIEPTLRHVQSPLVLVVEYSPNDGIKVNLSRKVNITSTISDAKEMVLDPEVEHKNHESIQDKKIKRGPKRDMTVTFPDGTIIAENKAADTLVAVVKKIGVAEVHKVVEDYNLKCCKVPVISNRRDARYGSKQKDLGGGWLLMTNSSNPTKKAFIEKVSVALHLGIKVTLG